MLEVVHKLIRIYYPMEDGCHIKGYQEELLILEGEVIIKIKHRALKHIVERRKQDNYTESDLLELFSDMFSILQSNRFKIVDNKDTKDNIFLLLELITDNNTGVVLVLEIIQQTNNNYFIKTGFYRSARKIKKLLENKK